MVKVKCQKGAVNNRKILHLNPVLTSIATWMHPFSPEVKVTSLPENNFLDHSEQ